MISCYTIELQEYLQNQERQFSECSKVPKIVSFLVYFMDSWRAFLQPVCTEPLVRIMHFRVMHQSLSERLKQALGLCESPNAHRRKKTTNYILHGASSPWCLSVSLTAFFYISSFMTGRLILHAAVFACAIFMGKKITCTQTDTFTLRVACRRVRNNFPRNPTALCNSLAHCPGISQ